MFDHVTIRVSDRRAAERFYSTLLGSLGITPTHVGDDFVEWDDFSLAAADEAHQPTKHLHVAFCAESRDDVDRFWRVGIDAGYADDGAPGERPQYMPGYYGAFLLDPDGNSVEATHHDDTRRGGHVDHLWIGVRDLDAAERFYDTIARHAGLRKGSRSDDRRQYRGAWATFSLVSDGRPPTEGLHIAFPAPDRRTVEDFHRAATTAGYRDNGTPGERTIYHPGYYAAYVLDPDGANVESVFHDRR
jgi:catechol 2,3-dioxygenase-like lactoylglutathione lyase family enzyme